MNTNIELGTKIKIARKASGMSQTALAEKLGKTLRTIQKYESGEIEPSVHNINQIANALGITSSELLGYQKQQSRLDTLSDLIFAINELNKKTDIRFEIEIKRPPENEEWTCTLRFDGHNSNAKYNADLCLFLERYKIEREKLETFCFTQEKFDEWFSGELANHENMKLAERPAEYLTQEEVLRRYIATHPEVFKSVMDPNESNIDK